MKKFVVTFFFLLAFAGYILRQRSPLAITTKQSWATNSNASPVTPSPAVIPAGALYQDGNYTGVAADAYYGYIQVRATIASGRLTAVKFLQYPNDRQRSIQINSYATPRLAQEAIRAQSADVDTISGATDTSYAFRQSLQSALTQAKGV